MTGGLEIAIDHLQGAFRLSVAFSAPAGVTAIFGRSGSGKTTLVNAVAGLIRPRRARIVVGREVLVDTEAGTDLARHRRRIGYVFQEGRLFPHLSVRQNLLFGRFFAGPGEGEPRLDAVVDLLGLGHLLARRPAGLSGGEKQRVAIGRALLSGPRLLLMDEPLASLDEARKDEILPYVERLRDEAKLPILYVSHAVSEVARLADTVVVLEGGALAAAGPARDVFARLDLAATWRGREAGAVIEASVEAHEEASGLTILATPAGRLRVPRLPQAVGAALRLQIRAGEVMLATERPRGLSALNILPGTVADLAPDPDGATVLVAAACGSARILARLTRHSAETLGLAPGRAVFAVIKSVSFERDGPARGM